MKGSGKQVLLKILSDLSTQCLPETALARATQTLRAGLLLHGSTSDDNFAAVGAVQWASDADADGKPWRQGIATTDETVFLADIVESLEDVPGLHAHLMALHPGLTPAGLQAALHTLWLIVTATQMFSQLRSVETTTDALDIDHARQVMMKHFDAYQARQASAEP